MVSHDKPVLQVIYRTGDGRQESLTTTAEHPFWIREEGWAVAGNLRPGDRLELHDRSDAEVIDLIDIGASADVFNFEIDGFRTDYVGEAGVWLKVGTVRSSSETGSFRTDSTATGLAPESQHLTPTPNTMRSGGSRGPLARAAPR